MHIVFLKWSILKECLPLCCLVNFFWKWVSFVLPICSTSSLRGNATLHLFCINLTRDRKQNHTGTILLVAASFSPSLCICWFAYCHFCGLWRGADGGGIGFVDLTLLTQFDWAFVQCVLHSKVRFHAVLLLVNQCGNAVQTETPVVNLKCV